MVDNNAHLFGLDVDTIAHGEHELLGQEVLRGRERLKGGSRAAIEKSLKVLPD